MSTPDLDALIAAVKDTADVLESVAVKNLRAALTATTGDSRPDNEWVVDCTCGWDATPEPTLDQQEAGDSRSWTYEGLTGDGWAIIGPDDEERHGDWKASGYGRAIALDREDAVRIVDALNAAVGDSRQSEGLRDLVTALDEQMAGDQPDYKGIARLAIAALRRVGDTRQSEGLRESIEEVLSEHDPEGTGFSRFGGDALIAALYRALAATPEPTLDAEVVIDGVLSAIAARQKYLGWMNAAEMLNVINDQRALAATPEPTLDAERLATAIHVITNHAAPDNRGDRFPHPHPMTISTIEQARAIAAEYARLHERAEASPEERA